MPRIRIGDGNEDGQQNGRHRPYEARMRIRLVNDVIDVDAINHPPGAPPAAPAAPPAAAARANPPGAEAAGLAGRRARHALRVEPPAGGAAAAELAQRHLDRARRLREIRRAMRADLRADRRQDPFDFGLNLAPRNRAAPRVQFGAQPVRIPTETFNMEEQKIKCHIFKSKVRKDLLEEQEQGLGNRYTLVCSNGEIMLGKLVLPFVSGFFGQQLDMLENIKPYSPDTGPTELDCKIYPIEIVQKFVDGIYGKELELSINDTVQLIRFIHGPGNYELYDWHKEAIDELLEGVRTIIKKCPKQCPNVHDKCLDLMVSLYDFPIPSTKLLTTCGKIMNKQQFESAFGRLIMKTHRQDFANWEYDYILPTEYLSLSLHNFYDSMKFDEEMDPRITFTIKINDVVKCLIEQYYPAVPPPPEEENGVPNQEDQDARLAQQIQAEQVQAQAAANRVRAQARARVRLNRVQLPLHREHPNGGLLIDDLDEV